VRVKSIYHTRPLRHHHQEEVALLRPRDAGGAQFGIRFVNPADPDYDRGHCERDRTHLANFTVGYQTPAFDNATLGTVASNWRVSGILNARSGPWMSILSGRDNAFNGMANQRADQVSNDVYGAKTLNNFLNPATFAQPAPGDSAPARATASRDRVSIKWIWCYRVSYP